MTYCNPTLLRITDGMFSVDLLDKHGVHASSWQPAIASFKDGGAQVSSPFVDGGYPVFGVYDRVDETLDVIAYGGNTNDLAQRLQTLRRLLRQASVFWFGRAGTTTYPNQITGVVWLEARMNGETNTRYAVLTGGGLQTDGQVIGQPLIQASGSSVMAELRLQMSRLHWTANRPGVGTPVAMSSSFYFSGTYYGTVEESQLRSLPQTEPVFLANKHSVSNITNVHNGTGGANLLDTFPYTLFDGGTTVLFGCTTLNQPISNIIFDLTTPAEGDHVIAWEYLSAAGPTWSALGTTYDGTDGFRNSGANVFSMAGQPSFDTATSPGGGLPSGIWIRARISSGSMTVEPVQDNRNIYSQTIGYANIEASAVEGDIPALAKLIIARPGDSSVLPSPTPASGINRVFGGIKTVYNSPDFGASAWNFTHIINFSESNPIGWTAEALGGSSITALQDAPTGRAISDTAIASMPFTSVASLLLDEALSHQYTGSFRLFIRAFSELDDDMRARVKIDGVNAAGNSVNTVYTRTEPLPIGSSPSSVTNIIDFGVVTLPVTGAGTEYVPRTPGRVLFTVQLENTNTSLTSLWVLWDMILIPISEWSFECSAPNLAGGSELNFGTRLEIDGISGGTPRATLIKVDDGTDVGTWTLIQNGHTRLNANSAQRLCLLWGAEIVTSRNSRITDILSVQYEVNQQYFSLRGDY